MSNYSQHAAGKAADSEDSSDRIQELKQALALAVKLVEDDVIRVRPSEREQLMEALATWNRVLAG